MKQLTFAVLIVLIGLSVIFERQAGYCGASFFTPSLPHGIEPDWLNGMFWLNNDEGNIVVSNFYQITTKGGILRESPVRGYPSSESTGKYFRIQRYAFDADLYAELARWDQRSYSIPENAERVYLIVGKDRGEKNNRRHVTKVVDDASFVNVANLKIEDLHWVSVGLGSCLYGKFNFLRIGLLAAILVVLRSFFRKRGGL